jgi:hypothetical protein
MTTTNAKLSPPTRKAPASLNTKGTARGAFFFFPARITVSYDLAPIGDPNAGKNYVRALPKGERTDGAWIVLDQNGRTVGAVEDSGYQSKDRWSFALAGNSSWEGLGRELRGNLKVAPSFARIVEKI